MKRKVDYSRSNLGPPKAANDNRKPAHRGAKSKPEVRPVDDDDCWSLGSFWCRNEHGVYHDDE